METAETRRELVIAEEYRDDADVVLYPGDCRGLLAGIPDGSARLVVTSPPYNIGKAYERRRSLDAYAAEQAEVIERCVAKLVPGGSICWQVGNYVDAQEIVPLDILLYPHFARLGLKLRNRIVWHFGHGLHCSRRFSGRYETILWFTRGDGYTFNLDPVRVPQKYPGKRYFKGPKVGQLSCNPLGKNPGDAWDTPSEPAGDAPDFWEVPNVKWNHPEKTAHPCQFPVELIERLVLALTDRGELVIDPYLGSGTSAVASVLHGRRAAGADIVPEYLALARERVTLAARGELRTRPLGRPIYVPSPNARQARREG